MSPSRISIAALAGIVLGGFAFAGDAGPAPARRCGWFVNPTPANAWLLDREGEWTVGTQGGPQAEGDWPDFNPSQWVETNGHYGYGCACMSVIANAGTHEITIIRSARAQSLRVCRQDRSLKAPR